MELLATALCDLAACKYCQSPLGIIETFSRRKGLITRIGFKCSNQSCCKSKLFSDPVSKEASSFNKAAVLGARLTGNGRATLDTITAWLGMPPPLSPGSYSVYNKELAEISGQVAENKMVEAANRLHRFD